MAHANRSSRVACLRRYVLTPSAAARISMSLMPKSLLISEYLYSACREHLPNILGRICLHRGKSSQADVTKCRGRSRGRDQARALKYGPSLVPLQFGEQGICDVPVGDGAVVLPSEGLA